MSNFTTAAKARTAIPFTLDGIDYTFTAPKQAAMIMPMLDGGDDLSVVRAGLKWLSDGLPDDQSTRLDARLKDPADDFDITDLQAIIEFLVEKAAADRPSS